MAKWRKTALTEASQWLKHGDHEAVKPIHPSNPASAEFGNDYGWIATLEGGHVVTPGDWIAGPGARGEFWPIKPDVFAATYEPAD